MRRAPRRHLSTDSEAVCCLGHRQRLAGCSNGTVAEPAVAATSALCYMYGCTRIQKRAAGDLRSVPSRHFSFSVLVLAVRSFSSRSLLSCALDAVRSSLLMVRANTLRAGGC
jgi:hypothetical protein